MSLMGRYKKEGKGVEKDAPKRSLFTQGFVLFHRNFFNFIKIGFLYMVSSIPMIAMLWSVFAFILYPNLEGVISMLATTIQSVELEQAKMAYFIAFLEIFIVEMLFIIGSGPASSAFAYAVRCIAREEHLWLWSDFKGKFKENFKQSIIVSLIDIVVVMLMCLAGFVYFSLYKDTGSLLYIGLLGVVALFCAFYAFMHGYIYQMLVTFDNKLSALYKNAFIFAFAKLPQNILLIGIPAVLSAILLLLLSPAVAIVLLITIWYPAMRYPIEFYGARAIKKVIDKKAEKGNDDR